MKKALIIQNKFIGDVLVASILAKNLKKIYPEIEVHFFCYSKAECILENNPYIDKVVSFQDEKLKNFFNLLKMSLNLRKENYDILLDPYAKLQSRIITLISGAKQKVSFEKPFFKHLYHHTIEEYKKPVLSSCTSIEDRIKLLQPIADSNVKFDTHTELFLTEEETHLAKQEMLTKGIDFSKPIIMIGVLGSELDKSLPLDYMAELINFLTDNYEANFLFNYVPNQQKEVDDILGQLNHPEKIYTNLTGNSVREFLALLSHCSVLIANEGGAINMAKALQIPTFSIYSPHKFREDWGCYEEMEIHKSIHLEDFYPELFHENSVKEILHNPKPLYQKFRTELITPSVQKYLESLDIQPNNKLKIKEVDNKNAKISALLITKNEENNIAEYLEDLDFADEIIIVDSFSTDKTKEIAIQHPKVKFVEKVFKNFSTQKNYAISLAKNEWVLFFDADERVNKSLKNEILHTIRLNPKFDAYFVKRKFYFLNKPMNFSGWQNDKAIRLFKKSKCKYGENKFVHETLIVDGNIGMLENRVNHFSLHSLESYQKKLDLYAKLKAQELFKKGAKANFFHFKIKPMVRFLHHYIFRFGILDGKNGYIMAKIYADYVYKRYYFLNLLRDNKD